MGNITFEKKLKKRLKVIQDRDKWLPELIESDLKSKQSIDDYFYVKFNWCTLRRRAIFRWETMSRFWNRRIR